MATTKTPKLIKSIWGPYYSAMVPNCWLNEAGQSASGKLLDFLTTCHPAYPILKAKSDESKKSIYETLDTILKNLANERGLKLSDISTLTKSIHVYPDFHGNRSPLADNQMTGAICGLKIDSSLENLAVLYLASMQSLAYQTKHIVELMKLNGCNFKIITVIGGLASNRMYCQLLSDIIELPVLVSTEKVDSIVLLGSSILGASNYQEYENTSFVNLIKQFGQSNLVEPLLPDYHLKQFHQKKYSVYLKMCDDQLHYRNLMQDN